jgi:hypothetical protein
MTRFDIGPDHGPDEPYDRDYEMAAAERGVELPPGYDEMSAEEEAYYASLDHDCPREQFLEDPITQAYGLGGDMDEWNRVIRCPVCEARDAE